MLRYFIVSILILLPLTTWSNVPDRFTQKNINYRTSFGECPSKSSGMLTLILMKEFEKSHSLKDVKEKILHEKLDEKYFLSDYRISYNPVIKTLRIRLVCPEPLAKVQFINQMVKNIILPFWAIMLRCTNLSTKI